MANNSTQLEKAVFAGGCFWCTEAIFKSLRGVASVMPGYTGGALKNPSYDDVATGRTGHAESIRIDFDPKLISYRDLLTVFFNTHDPTTLNMQGHDIGTEYRSAIFYATPEQEHVARDMIRELTEAGAYDKPIVTEVAPLGEFFPAEDYHRNYFATNRSQPYCELVIAPKLEKFQKRFADLLAASDPSTAGK
jgi:peptide-methionine (S)-S-oxide reductase